MNWFSKIAKEKTDEKPMPMPFTTEDRSGGTKRIDREMSQQTADQLKKQYPEIEFLGAGGIGVAGQSGNNVIKFTSDEDEAMMAKQLMKINIPCIVKIYSVKKVQEPRKFDSYYNATTIWVIECEKVNTNLTLDQKRLAGDMNAILQIGGWSTMPSEFIRQGWESKKQYVYEKTIKEFPQEQQFINDYLEMRMCLDKNNIIADDAHGDNIGYNKQGKLVLFDLGYSEFQEKQKI